MVGRRILAVNARDVCHVINILLPSEASLNTMNTKLDTVQWPTDTPFPLRHSPHSMYN